VGTFQPLALYLEFTNLTQSFNNNKDRKSLNEFLSKNDNIVIVPCDKTKNLTILYFDEYARKITETFADESKFRLIESLILMKFW